MLYNKEWTELFNSLESEVEDERERIIKLCECVKVSKKLSILSEYLDVAHGIGVYIGNVKMTLI